MNKVCGECAEGTMAPTQDIVRETFDYIGGGLVRKSTGTRGYRRKDGYIYTRLAGKSYGEHRLVHLLFTGEWPDQVDHINGIKDDNRPTNLRSATHAQNCMNRKNTRAIAKGCYWIAARKKWMV